MSTSESEYVFRLAMRVARQLPEDQQQNFAGAVNLARSGMISMDTLMNMLDEMEGADANYPSPRQSQPPSYADVTRTGQPAQPFIQPPLPPQRFAPPAALRPGRAQAHMATSAPRGSGPPETQTVPLTRANVQALGEGKGREKGEGKGREKGEGKGRGRGKGKKDKPRAPNGAAARRNLNQFLQRHPDFVFQPRDDIPKTMQQLWSQLEEDRDNLPRALQKHFRNAPQVLENIVADMVTHTHWPVDKNNVVEKESKAKRAANGDCNTFISKMSNLSSRTTRLY